MSRQDSARPASVALRHRLTIAMRDQEQLTGYPSRLEYGRSVGFSRSKRSGATRVETLIFGTDESSELVAVVGESHYQDTLRSLCGSQRWEDVGFDWLRCLSRSGTIRTILTRSSSKVDPRLVGYLSREDAVGYRRLISEAHPRFIQCEARIAGRGPGSETPNLGVFLRLPPPDHQIRLG